MEKYNLTDEQIKDFVNKSQDKYVKMIEEAAKFSEKYWSTQLLDWEQNKRIKEMTEVLQPCGRLHSPLEGCSHCEAIKWNIMKGEANCSHGIAMGKCIRRD